MFQAVVGFLSALAGLGEEEDVHDVVVPSMGQPTEALAATRTSTSRVEARMASPRPVALRGLAPGTRHLLEPALCEQRHAEAWNLAYSTDQHGISIHTMLHACARAGGPILLCLRTLEGEVLGGFLSGPVDPGALHYYGTGEAFLFRVTWGPDGSSDSGSTVPPRLHCYPATLANPYYVLTNPTDGVTMGNDNGSYGFYIDTDLLRGESNPCCTFGNPALARGGTFDVDVMQCWSFQW